MHLDTEVSKENDSAVLCQDEEYKSVSQSFTHENGHEGTGMFDDSGQQQKTHSPTLTWTQPKPTKMASKNWEGLLIDYESGF